MEKIRRSRNQHWHVRWRTWKSGHGWGCTRCAILWSCSVGEAGEKLTAGNQTVKNQSSTDQVRVGFTDVFWLHCIGCCKKGGKNNCYDWAFCVSCLLVRRRGKHEVKITLHKQNNPTVGTKGRMQSLFRENMTLAFVDSNSSWWKANYTVEYPYTQRQEHGLVFACTSKESFFAGYLGKFPNLWDWVHIESSFLRASPCKCWERLRKKETITGGWVWRFKISSQTTEKDTPWQVSGPIMVHKKLKTVHILGVPKPSQILQTPWGGANPDTWIVFLVFWKDTNTH